jgi:hypothetical protein
MIEDRGAPMWTRRHTRSAVAVIIVVLLFALIASLVMRLRPRLTEETARSVVTASLQRESRQSFVVTGALDITVSTRVRHSRRLLPGMIDLEIASTESNVRAPGRVSYGFPVGELKPESIEVAGDTIVVRVPDPRVYSVEPDLARMEVQTRTGWLKLDANEAEVQQRATALVQTALRSQAQRHLHDSEQPRINTAATLHDILLPAFRASGIREPIFRFIINEQLVYTPRDR